MSGDSYVLFVGPYPPPIHGQSYAFKMAYDHYPNPKIMISQNLETNNVLLRIWKAIKCIVSYFYTFNKYKISVVYVAGSRSVLGSFKDVILFHLASRHKAKIIDHVHAAHFHKFLDELPGFLKNYYIRSYKKVNVFIALLPEMRSEYDDFATTAKLEVIENFFDPKMNLLESNPSDHSLSEPIVISYFSNLIYSKGIFDLLEAFLKLKKNYSNIKLQIAGNYGSDSYMNAEEVRQKLIPYLQNSDIQYAGILQRIEKIKFLQRSQIFVLPSYYSSEAFPISILEAMRCGNAIIVSDHHYLPGLVDSSRGRVVNSKDPDSICAALEELILSHEVLNSMRKKNIDYASQKYSLNNYTTRINHIIDQSLRT